MRQPSLVGIIAIASVLSLAFCNTVYLTNADFDQGTYIIKEPGTYIVQEDLIFNALLPEILPQTGPYSKANFQLGFFAAISIESDDVVLDLNGYELIQGEMSFLIQRFYCHIELGSSPFRFGGPHNFNEDYPFIPVKNVVIKNGKMGKTSHHAIHGNDASYVVIKDLIMYDFEVAGVHFNGGSHITIENCVIGPSLKQVPVQGTFSAAHFIQGYVRALAQSGQICTGDNSEPFLTVRGSDISASEILTQLKQSIQETVNSFLSGHYHDIDPIYANPGLLPDGSTISGIIFNERKPAVGPLLAKLPTQTEFNCHNVVKNVIIKDMKLRVREIVGLQHDSTPHATPFIDARGAVYRYKYNLDQEGYYRPNALSNAQLLVSKYKSCLQNNKNYFRSQGHKDVDTSRDIIPQKILNWAACVDHCEQFTEGLVPVCGGDDMAHNVKGIIGLRLAGNQDLLVQNLKIENLENVSPFGATDCGNYQAGMSQISTVPGYQGADVRGITVECGKDITFENVDVTKLTAHYGGVIGIDVLFDSQNISGNVNCECFSAPNWQTLPASFSKVPQQSPVELKASISAAADVSLLITGQV